MPSSACVVYTCVHIYMQHCYDLIILESNLEDAHQRLELFLEIIGVV